MNYYNTDRKIHLLDEVETSHGKRGVVIGFEVINGKDYVQVHVKNDKLWASTNAIEQPSRTLKVTHE